MTSMSTNHVFSRSLLTTAASIALACTLAIPGVALAAADTEEVWIYGDDRYDTSAQIAMTAYPDGASTVVIASGDDQKRADSLSASSLAGLLDVPILLTQDQTLPDSVAEAISELGATDALIVGGTGSVGDGVAAQLQDAGLTCERIAGDNRFDTQASIYMYGIEYGVEHEAGWNPDIIMVANGYSFADALSASSVAFAQQIPIFIAGQDGTFSDMQVSCLSEITATQAVILGGTNSVSDRTMGFIQSVMEYASITATGDVAADVTRVSGVDRYGTSAALANWADGLGYLDWTQAAVTNGSSGADALVGGVLQGKSGSMMLLVSGSSTSTISLLSEHADEVEQIRFLGGPATMGDDVVAAIVDALGIASQEDDSDSDELVIDEEDTAAN